MNLRVRTSAFFVAVCVLLSATAAAQISVNVDSLSIDSFPKVQVQVTAKQGNLLVLNKKDTSYKVIEDGLIQKIDTIICPEGFENFSLVFVIGNGSSMSQVNINAAATIAIPLIDQFDGINDEGAVVIYSTGSLPGNHSVDRDGIKSNMQGIVSSPTAADALLDGVWAALYTSGTFRRTVLLLTNGVESGSLRTLDDCIQRANTTSTRIFAVGVNPTPGGIQLMQAICNGTGGRYFTDAAEAVQHVLFYMRGTPGHCTITYTSDNLCRDGGDRVVTVQDRIGGGTATDDTVFAMPADAGTNVNVHIGAKNVTVVSGKQAKLPIELVESVAGQRLYPSTMSLKFDTNLLTLDSIGTSGALATGNTFIFSPTADGAGVTISGASKLSSRGDLFYLYFNTQEVQQNTDVPVEVTAFTPSRGCLIVEEQDGQIRLEPKKASIALAASSIVFNWDAINNLYTPQTETVVVEVTNNGDKDVSGLMAEMTFAPEVRFAGTSTAIAPVVPSLLKPGDKGTATWLLRPVATATEVTAQIPVTVTGDEGVTATKNIFANIKAATEALKLRCPQTVDTIRVIAGQHTPNPVALTVQVAAAGSNGGPASDVTIEAPVAITLSPPVPLTKNVNALNAGGTADVSWVGVIPPVSKDTTFEIRFTLSVAGGLTDTCIMRLAVEGLVASQLSATCVAPEDTLRYNTVSKVYEPSPLMASIVVRNSASVESDSVIASLQTSALLSLMPGELPQRVFTVPANDSVTVTWSILPPGNGLCATGAATVQWSVRTLANELISACVQPVVIEARPNANPQIISQTPAATPDTIELQTGKDIAFSVSTQDSDGDKLAFAWVVNGTTVTGETDSSATLRFDSTKIYVVTCQVTDTCGERAVATWTLLGVLRATDPTLAAKDFAILGNYPNPFNPGTVVEYRVPAGLHMVALDLLDGTGRFIRTLFRGSVSAGLHRYALDGSGMASGVYYVRMRSGERTLLHPITLAK